MFSARPELSGRSSLAVVTAAAGAFSGLLLYVLYGIDRADTTRLLVVLSAASVIYGLATTSYPYVANIRRRRQFVAQTDAGLAPVRHNRQGSYDARDSANRRLGFTVGLLLRIAAVFAFPALSDDVYRFLWDGGLWWAGLSPFTETPAALAASSQGAAFAKTHGSLLDAMNSPGYYTVYPPLSQLVFALAGWIQDPYWGSVALKLVLLAGELAVWRTLSTLLMGRSAATRLILLYWLNPLVIIEVIGSAHFESLALLFVLLCMLGLQRANPDLTVGEPVRKPRAPRLGYVILAGLALAAASLTKLVPLIFAPAITLYLLWGPTIELDSASATSATPPRREPCALDAEQLNTSEGKTLDQVYAAMPSSDVEPTATRSRFRPASSIGPHALPGEVGFLKCANYVDLRVRVGYRLWHWMPAFAFALAVLLPFLAGMTVTLGGPGVTGFGESLDLYFRNFEFNGSLYSVARALGQWYKGWNWIAVIGPSLSALGTVLILAVSVYRNWRGFDLATTLVYCGAAYFACATTVHPWYFVYLVGLCVLTPYRWPLLLSCTAFLSYAAYAKTDVAVPTWALLLEYVPVVMFGIFEYHHRTRTGLTLSLKKVSSATRPLRRRCTR